MKKKKLSAKPIAVETLTLVEIRDMFWKSMEIAYPKSKGVIEKELKHIKRMGRSNHKWIKTYEEYIGAKISFYLEKGPHHPRPKEKIGMTHRTKKGLILITEISTGESFSYEEFNNGSKWSSETMIYTGHFCERYAERILKIKSPTFQMGCEAVMYNDLLGAVRVMEELGDGIEKIEVQYPTGQAYGFYDSKNKITYLRTIYSDDMLKRERLEFKMEMEPTLTELFEKTRLK